MKLIRIIFFAFVRLFFRVMVRIWGEPKMNVFERKVQDLYKGEGFLAEFCWIRLWDAPFSVIEKMVPKKGMIVDLGCGDGILTNYLGLAGGERRLLGIEINKRRVGEADKGLVNVDFRAGDILKVAYPQAEVILLTHVLHHLPSREAQERILKKCYACLEEEGKLIITEISEKPRVKYWFTWLTDAVTVPILFENRLFTTDFYYRKDDEWKELLTRMGFVYRITKAHRGMPFSHIIFECKKV